MLFFLFLSFSLPGCSSPPPTPLFLSSVVYPVTSWSLVSNFFYIFIHKHYHPQEYPVVSWLHSSNNPGILAYSPRGRARLLLCLGWPNHMEMATHSSILAWRIPWLVGYSSRGCKKSDTTEQLHLTTCLFCPFCFFLCFILGSSLATGRTLSNYLSAG